MNLVVKFNILKNTQPHYSYTPESCLENDNYKLYFDRTVLTDIHIKHLWCGGGVRIISEYIIKKNYTYTHVKAAKITQPLTKI
jgi:hypothetical protein